MSEEKKMLEEIGKRQSKGLEQVMEVKGCRRSRPGEGFKVNGKGRNEKRFMDGLNMLFVNVRQSLE
jgi:hypothetical protein